MKCQLLKKIGMAPTNRRRAALLATRLLILATAWPVQAEGALGAQEKSAAAQAPTVRVKPIGQPAWRLADLQLFTAPVGTAASGYAEFGTTMVSILPPPNHQFCPELGGPGPGVPHPPPYTSEMSAGVTALGFPSGPRFRPEDFSNGNGVYCTWITVPNGGITGSSPDFSSGPIIPNTLFPIHVSGATYRNGQLSNPFLGTFDVPPLTAALSCPFNVDGPSHFPIFFADNMDFMPSGTNPVGAWEFRVQMTDSAGHGWDVSAHFVVARP